MSQTAIDLAVNERAVVVTENAANDVRLRGSVRCSPFMGSTGSIRIGQVCAIEGREVIAVCPHRNGQ